MAGRSYVDVCERTIVSDGLALEEGEAVGALKTGHLAIGEEGTVLGLPGVALHGLGLDDLDLKAVVGGSTEDLQCQSDVQIGPSRGQHAVFFGSCLFPSLGSLTRLTLGWPT